MNEPKLITKTLSYTIKCEITTKDTDEVLYVSFSCNGKKFIEIPFKADNNLAWRAGKNARIDYLSRCLKPELMRTVSRITNESQIIGNYKEAKLRNNKIVQHIVYEANEYLIKEIRRSEMEYLEGLKNLCKWNDSRGGRRRFDWSPAIRRLFLKVYEEVYANIKDAMRLFNETSSLTDWRKKAKAAYNIPDEILSELATRKQGDPGLSHFALKLTAKRLKIGWSTNLPSVLVKARKERNMENVL